MINKLLKHNFISLVICVFCVCISSLPLFAQEPRPMRIISLAPSTTEILFALGLKEEIVGVSSYCDYPPEANTVTKVGDFSHPNLEKIMALKPDYIFCTGLEQMPVVTELKRLKFNVYVADPSTIDELLTTINDMGKLTNKEREATELIKNMKNDIAAVESRAKLIPQKKKAKVFIEIWHEPLMTAGKGSFVDELITLAGGINIAHDITRPYSIFNAEKVISLNPQCIIMTYMDREPPLKIVEKRFGWKNIEAVKNNRVFNDIDPNILLRPGPRITEGLKEIYNHLYPKE
jgi:iron complex transport system substrate-binding protein